MPVRPAARHVAPQGAWPLPLLTLLTRTTAQEAKAAFVVGLARQRIQMS